MLKSLQPWLEAQGLPHEVATPLAILGILLAFFGLVLCVSFLISIPLARWQWSRSIVESGSKPHELTREEAHAFLLENDPAYAYEQAAFELVRRRSKMRGEGIGPGDPRYPDIWDVFGEEPPWPLDHRTARLEARAAMSQS